jgi:hypothetical protein
MKIVSASQRACQGAWRHHHGNTHLVHAKVKQFDITVVVTSQNTSLLVIERVPKGNRPAIPARPVSLRDQHLA